jgi:hypothetical protein
MKLRTPHMPSRLALMLGTTMATLPLSIFASNIDKPVDEFQFFFEAEGSNSTAPLSIIDVLKGKDPTQHDTSKYQPRVQWRDQVKAGLANDKFELYLHATKLGRIKTDNQTLNFWSDYSQKGFAPDDGKIYRVNWDSLNLEAKGLGAQYNTKSNDAISIQIGANFGVIDSFDQRLITGDVQRVGTTSTLNANIAKTSTTPYINQLQSSAGGNAAWLNLRLVYAQPQSPLSVMFNAPILLGSAHIQNAAFIHTNLNYSETNNVLKNNSQTTNIGTYGNTDRSIKLPNFWELSGEYAHSPSTNAILFVDGIDAATSVFIGNRWKSALSDGTDLELLIDKERQTFLMNMRSRGHYSAGIGISRLNTTAPVSFRFSYRY